MDFLHKNFFEKEKSKSITFIAFVKDGTVVPLSLFRPILVKL